MEMILNASFYCAKKFFKKTPHRRALENKIFIITCCYHPMMMQIMDVFIPKSLQLIAGRTAQKYKIRKKRKGAFWENSWLRGVGHYPSCHFKIPPSRKRAPGWFSSNASATDWLTGPPLTQ